MPTKADIILYYCDRCEVFGRELDAIQKHEISDAEHLKLERVGYVKRPITGVVFYYPFFWLGTKYSGTATGERWDDEKWLEKPVYEIFVKELDGGRRTLETVNGIEKANKAFFKHSDELYKKEGRVTVKKFLGIFPYKVHD